MLTKELGIAKFERECILPDRLTKSRDSQYLHYADQMFDLYKRGKGKTRGELHRKVHDIFAKEPECPSRRIDAFCKLLDEGSIFNTDKRGKAAELRLKIFNMAGTSHPLVSSKDSLFGNSEKEVKEKIAKKLKKKWDTIDKDLFSDVPENHRLLEFKGYEESRAILSRYNVAQVQVALYQAIEMTIWIFGDLKMILRHAKLARLMHTITHEGQGRYKITFDGPSSILRETQRYGVYMAKFLPALLNAKDWRMSARIKLRKKGLYKILNLTSNDGFKSHLTPPEEFDSDLEKELAEKWGTEKREGWSLTRESELLHQGQKVFFPDFILTHEDGRKIYFEIIGFWTPEYLKAKLDTLEIFKNHPILIAIMESKAEKFPALPPNAIRFKSKLKLKEILSRL